MDPRFSSSRSRSPLASPPIGQTSRRNRRPSHSPPPPARRRSPSPLTHAYQDSYPRFSQAGEEHLSSRPNTPPTPGVPDMPTSNNSLTANQTQAQTLNQNQNQIGLGHLPNASQATFTSSLPPQTSRPSQPTRPITGPLLNSRLPSRPSELPLQPSPSSQFAQPTQPTSTPESASTSASASASARPQTTMRSVPVAVPLSGHGAPHRRMTPAPGPSAAQVRSPNLSSRLSQPAQPVVLPLSQPPQTHVQYPPSPPHSASETVRQSQTVPLQPQTQSQPQSQSHSQLQQRTQPSSHRSPQNVPAPQASQASHSTHPTPPVKPLSSQSKGSTAVNTGQGVNQGTTIPPLTGTRTGAGTDQHQHQLDVKNMEAVVGAGARAENSKGTNQSLIQSQVKSEDKKDNSVKGRKKNAGKKKGKGKEIQNGAQIAKVESQKGKLQLKSENQNRDQNWRNGTDEAKEEKIDANLNVEQGEHGEKNKVDQKGQSQKEKGKPKVIPDAEAETFSSSQGSLHFSLPVVDTLPLSIHPARPEHAKLTQPIQPDHPSQSSEPFDSFHLPSSLPFPQSDTLGLASSPDVLTTPGASHEQALSLVNNGSMQSPLPPSQTLASSSSLSSPNASVRSVQALQPLQSTMASSDRAAGSSTEHEQILPSSPGQVAHVPRVRPDAHTSTIPSPLFLRMPPISSPSASPHNLSSRTLASSSTTASQVSVPMQEKEKDKDQIKVDQNGSQAGKIESVDKGKGEERLGDTQGAGLFTVAGAVPLSFWVYGGSRARTLEIVITVSSFPLPISLSIHLFLFFWISSMICP